MWKLHVLQVEELGLCIDNARKPHKKPIGKLVV